MKTVAYLAALAMMSFAAPAFASDCPSGPACPPDDCPKSMTVAKSDCPSGPSCPPDDCPAGVTIASGDDCDNGGGGSCPNGLV